MYIYRELKESQHETTVALGYFDGVHMAHQKVIKKMIEQIIYQLFPTVLTFKADVEFPNKKGLKTILSDRAKLDMFTKLAVMQTYIIPFSEVINLSPNEFFYKILVEKLKAKAIVCGYDYTFGKNAMGDTDLLSELCEKNKIRLIVVNPCLKNGELISATQIREYISSGEIKLANELLGYTYYINGEVVHGNNLGKTLGFPTANMEFEEVQVVPKFGVYETNTFINRKIYKSITNVGVKPTIKGERKPLAETHIIGLDREIYGEEITVSFTRMIRPEQKFESIEKLKQAIAQDISNINSIH